MNYRVTCLTPTLVGDGQKLSPIDYMVWKDQVNVLDQRRIIKLLSKGPRLESYLTQVKRAEKLDFASWGGFAQNFADRRIPFEHSSLTQIWERQRAETLFIPTFSSGPSGPFLPGSALRGAFHTALLFARWTDHASKVVADRCDSDRLPRWPAEPAEDAVLGLNGHSRLRPVAFSDSASVATAAMKVFVVRTSTLLARGGKIDLGWKQSPRGSVEGRRVEDATPLFCEMASPGTAFEGSFLSRSYFAQPEVARAMRWRDPLGAKDLAVAANAFSKRVLGLHREYAATAGLKALDENLQQVEAQLEACKQAENSCLVNLGWGGGFLSKVSAPDIEQESFRKILRLFPFYGRAIQTGLPFPKTRRVVFLGNSPAALPGWVRVEIS